MKFKVFRRHMFSVLFLVMLVAVAAHAGDDYLLTQSLIAAGGSQSSNQGYQLTSVIGQSTVGKSDAGNYEVSAGFVKENRDLIFFNEFENNN